MRGRVLVRAVREAAREPSIVDGGEVVEEEEGTGLRRIPVGSQGSAHSYPRVWKVSRQRPIFGPEASVVMAWMSRHVGRCVVK